MGFVRIFWKNNVQEAYLPKMSRLSQRCQPVIIVAQLCLQNSIQTLLIFWGGQFAPKCSFLASRPWTLFFQNILRNPIISELSFLGRHTLVLYSHKILLLSPLGHKNGFKGQKGCIIIHSKYFSVSHWLKSHAQFIITSYCWPYLEPITSKLQQSCRLLQIEEGVINLGLRPRWITPFEISIILFVI